MLSWEENHFTGSSLTFLFLLIMPAFISGDCTLHMVVMDFGLFISQYWIFFNFRQRCNPEREMNENWGCMSKAVV